MGESLEQAKNRAARAIAEPDWLASGRARYLHDADFHAVVEVVCQERYGDIRSKLSATEAALAESRGALNIAVEALTWVAEHRGSRVAKRALERLEAPHEST